MTSAETPWRSRDEDHPAGVMSHCVRGSCSRCAEAVAGEGLSRAGRQGGAGRHRREKPHGATQRATLQRLLDGRPTVGSATFGLRGCRTTKASSEIAPAGAKPPSGWAKYPNLRHRPHAPNAGRGRLQRQIRRAFMVHGPELSATTIYDRCALWPVDKRTSQAQRWSVRRILDATCDRVGRSRGPGRPWIWRNSLGRRPFPPRQIEIIDEIGMWPILPILQPMFAPRKGVDIGVPPGSCASCRYDPCSRKPASTLTRPR
jgi:hypothetical protein